MPNTTPAVPRIVPQFGRDGRPAWYVVEAPDGTRIDFACGLNVIGGRLETEDDTPGQLMVHINTEEVGEADTYEEGMPKLVVSVNDGEIYDDQGRGNVAEPDALETPIYVVQTSEGPYLFVDQEQAALYAQIGGHQWFQQGARLWSRREGAEHVREAAGNVGKGQA